MTKPKERLLWDENPNEPDQLVIKLPIALPSWNRILGQQEFARMRLRHLLRAFTFYSLTVGTDWPTRMVCQGKQCSTLLLRLEYSQMIRPRKSRKSAITKFKSVAKKTKKRP